MDYITVISLTIIWSACFYEAWMHPMEAGSLCHPAVDNKIEDTRPAEDYFVAEFKNSQLQGEIRHIEAKSLDDAKIQARNLQESQWTILVLLDEAGDEICRARDGRSWMVPGYSLPRIDLQHIIAERVSEYEERKQ